MYKINSEYNWMLCYEAERIASPIYILKIILHICFGLSLLLSMKTPLLSNAIEISQTIMILFEHVIKVGLKIICMPII